LSVLDQKFVDIFMSNKILVLKNLCQIKYWFQKIEKIIKILRMNVEVSRRQDNKTILAVTRPNQTQFDGFSPF